MKRRRKGFTMIEMLIVIALMALVASIAVPMVVGQIGNANKQSDETIYEDIRQKGYLALTGLKGKTINNTSVINYIYDVYGGYYTSETNYDQGDCPLTVLPHNKRAGKCVTIQLVKMNDGTATGSSGIIVRFYEDANPADVSNEKLGKYQKGGKPMVKYRPVPGLFFTPGVNDVVEVNENLVEVTPTPPAGGGGNPAP